jgi:citrate synthase
MTERKPADSAPAAGLEGVVVAQSELSYVDGQAGKLVYRGHPIEDLAEHSTFEETCMLILDGDLPTRADLEAFRSALGRERALDEPVLDLIRALPHDAEPMAALRP